MIKIIKFNLLILGVFSASCAQNVITNPIAYIKTETVYSKNYDLGEMRAVNVGEPLVVIQDYKVSLYSGEQMQPSENFVISAGPVRVSGKKGADYIVRGSSVIEGVKYTVVNLPGSYQSGAGYGLLVREDGTVHPKLLNDKMLMIYDFNVFPEHLKFKQSSNKIQKKEKGRLHYELIYTGTDGDKFTITYREYTDDGLARAPFFQSLIYQVGQTEIRFKQLLIKIEKVDNNSITYTVLEDGL